MLQKLSDQISDCLARAAQARSRAEDVDDPAMKAEYLRQERCWNRLAQSFAFAESAPGSTIAG